MQNFQLRLNQIIKEESANFILKELKDNLLITIISVISNHDGSRADVYYVVYPSSQENINKCINILINKKTEIQNLISKKHNLRKTPILNFCYDQEYNKINEIEKTLNNLNEE